MESLQKLEKAWKNISKSWNPPPDLLISEWAETYGVLTAESSAEPGHWRNYPYQIAMMDAFCQPETEKVTILKSARIGYTKILGHVIGYHIHQDPCSMLVVQPTINDAEGYSKEELQPMIEETPALLRRIGSAKSRNSGNTLSQKKYPGGLLHMVGANAPTGFRRITVRNVFFDEVDAYPATAGIEGDQIKLGEKRSETFHNRKTAIGSTPTIKGLSRVEASFDQSSKGYFFLNCPECGGQHIRLFSQPTEPIILRGKEIPISHLNWEKGKPDTAKWVCPECGSLISHEHHRAMLNGGQWIGEDWEWTRTNGFSFADTFSGHIGFRIWAGYSFSPNSTPPKIATEFVQVSEDDEQLKTFVNTVLGESWEDKGEQANSHTLLSRREQYIHEVPEGGLILTLGADVQKDRIECEVVAWGKGEESWSIDYVILPGNTEQDEVWDDLEEVLKQSYHTLNGQKMQIRAACIDSGYLSKKVYDFVADFRSDYVFAVKGQPGRGRDIVLNKEARHRRLRKRLQARTRYEPVGVDEAKLLLYQRLANIFLPGPGYCHFPMERDEEYFEQLTAEKLVKKRRNGIIRSEWVKTRERNEALDVRVYAYAALLLSGVDLDKYSIKPESKPKPRKSHSQRNRNHGFGSDDWAL